ncbi:MAG: DUF4330 domain-containing protein [Clostridiales bacterium]|nr:DUF4330 domain-containing protein [Clostridiales bacterium]
MSKPRFNIVDGLVILAVIAVIAAAIWFFASAAPGDERYVYFVVEFQGQLPDFEDNITVGYAPEAEVRDSIRLYFLGHAWDVRSRPAEIITFDNTVNEFVLETIPDRYDVFLTIRGVGTEDDTSIQSNGQIVRVGQEMFIRGRGYAGIGFITEIRTTER